MKVFKEFLPFAMILTVLMLFLWWPQEKAREEATGRLQATAQNEANNAPPTFNDFGMNNINYIVGAVHMTLPNNDIRNDYVRADDPERRQYARDIGAQWNRWVLWWHLVNHQANGCTPDDINRNNPYLLPDGCPNDLFTESSTVIVSDSLSNQDPYIATQFCPPFERINNPDNWNWREGPEGDWWWYDTIAANRTFEHLVVLQGVPKCFQVDPGARGPIPDHLQEPIFRKRIEGTNQFTVTEFFSEAIPGPEGINPQNYWAHFAYEAMRRYGTRVTYWQIWNETNNETQYWPLPHHPSFGTHPDFATEEDRRQAYARLIEVAYWASRQAERDLDKDLKLLLGGLADERSLGATEAQRQDSLEHTQDFAKHLIKKSEKGHQCGDETCRYIDYLDIYAWHKYIGPWGTFEWTRWLQEEALLDQEDTKE